LSNFTPSDQQNEAIKAVINWYNQSDGSRSPFFYLGGVAGTGKTSCARTIADQIGGNVLYAAFTGKAALVLRGKGCVDATTIHSLIYKAIEDEETGEVDFLIDHESKVREARLVIVDECSMVSEDMGKDLLKFQTPVLVLGDPAQLPPVKGLGFFTSGKPDFMLTEVHRQAQDNPIIRLSMMVRNRERLVPGRYGDSIITTMGGNDPVIMEDYEQTICGLNKTRRTLNEMSRTAKGFDDPFPVVGDRLVCLKNERELGVLNGGLWDVTEIKMRYPKSITMTLRTADDGYRPEFVRAYVHHAFFNGTEKEIDWRERKKYNEFDYGYALTCHKAQGSTFKSCLIIDESASFREDRYKWLYTAITRASDRITLIVD
jgi:exodeoxyribonuclease V